MHLDCSKLTKKIFHMIICKLCNYSSGDFLQCRTDISHSEGGGVFSFCAQSLLMLLLDGSPVFISARLQATNMDSGQQLPLQLLQQKKAVRQWHWQLRNIVYKIYTSNTHSENGTLFKLPDTCQLYLFTAGFSQVLCLFVLLMHV